MVRAPAPANATPAVRYERTEYTVIFPSGIDDNLTADPGKPSKQNLRTVGNPQTAGFSGRLGRDNRLMSGIGALGRRSAAAVAAAVAVVLSAAEAPADDAAPALPGFVPSPSNWTPNYTVYPYNLWQSRVTPEQIAAQRDACQWFNAQYGTLRDQIAGFQRDLAARSDDWTTPDISRRAAAVLANVGVSTAFLEPRARTLYVVNYPDRSEYSPLFHGDSFHYLWFQLTQIGDKIARQIPSGQINANVATMNVYGNAIRDSGVCAGA